MSHFLCDTTTGLPVDAWGLWYYHFIASHLFHVGCTYVSSWFPVSVMLYSKLKEQQQSRTASGSPDLPNWLESHLRHFCPRVNILSQEFGHQNFYYFLIFLAVMKTCILWEPSSVGLVWCYLTIGEMSWDVRWARKSDSVKSNEHRQNLILFYFFFFCACSAFHYLYQF